MTKNENKGASKQKHQVVQELPPNTDLAKVNQDLEARLREATNESDQLKLQVMALAREIGDMHAQMSKIKIEKEAMQRDHDGKKGEHSHWEEKCH